MHQHSVIGIFLSVDFILRRGSRFRRSPARDVYKRQEQADFLSAAAAWSSVGKPIVITKQVPHEGSDLVVYQVGARAAAQPGMLQAYTMTVEAVVTKLMWICLLYTSRGV